MLKTFFAIALSPVALTSTFAAEMVIDDFVEDGILEHVNVNLWQDAIGEYGGSRSTFVFDRRIAGKPTSVVDIDNEVSSVLVSTLSDIPPLAGGFPDDIIMRIGNFFSAQVGTTDLTDHGTNDTLFYDFAFVEGTDATTNYSATRSYEQFIGDCIHSRFAAIRRTLHDCDTIL